MFLAMFPPEFVVMMVLFLAVVFQVKHFLADYPLQFGFMLKKFLPGWGFFWPLVAHCSVHAVMTLGIVCWFDPSLWWLALVDFGVHFVMDRIKAGPRYIGRFKALSSGDFQGLSAYGDKVRKQKLRSNTFFLVVTWLGSDGPSFNSLLHYL